MGSYNRVILVGNLTRDVEIRYISTGTAVTDVGLAVNEKTKKDGVWEDTVTFVDVTLWGRTAEVAAEFLRKGSPILIEGKLRLESWEAQDGTKRNKLKVVADRMQMLGRANGNGNGNSQNTEAPATAAPVAASKNEEQIPF
jgi:single-strand DNA-binding protein